MNIANHVERVARTDPARQAIVFEGRNISYGALDACACALAHSLRANGVRRGERVALYLPNIPAFMLAYLAGEKLGAIVVSVNSIFKSEEVKYLPRKLRRQGGVHHGGTAFQRAAPRECPR